MTFFPDYPFPGLCVSGIFALTWNPIRSGSYLFFFEEFSGFNLFSALISAISVILYFKPFSFLYFDFCYFIF